MNLFFLEKCPPCDERLPAVLMLIQSTFAHMEGRIDPPSSVKRLTLNDIIQQCETGEVWVHGNPPKACVFLKENNGRLYLGELAVDTNLRGQGIAKQLVELAETRAIQQGIYELELEVRIELTENHRVFETLGFFNVSEGAHGGYDRSTFLTTRKTLEV